MEKTRSNAVTAARIKASELREKECYAKNMEESLDPRDVDAGVVPGVEVREAGTPPVMGRTPVQGGGSSSSGGGGPPPVVPMSLDHDPKRPREVAEHFGDFGEELRKRSRMLREAGVAPVAKAAGPSKRGPEDQGDRGNVTG